LATEIYETCRSFIGWRLLINSETKLPHPPSNALR
jgi:hypothetical protein